MRSHRFQPALIALLLTLVFFVSDVNAQKIYLLMTADISEKGQVGASTRPSISLIRNVFRMNVPTNQLVIYGEEHQGENPWLGQKIDNKSPDLDKRILQAIRACPAGPNDTIMFGYNGHGGYANEKHCIQMPGGGPLVPRERIVEAIRAKNVRLAVVMTDSCAGLIRVGIEAMEPCMAPPTAISPLFDSLFIQTRGLVDFNSSTRGQLAYGIPNFGGVMILAMASHRDIFDSRNNPNLPPYGVLWEHKDERLSWADFKAHLISKTDELFQKLKEMPGSNITQSTQTPHFFNLPGNNSCCCDCNQRCGFLRRLIQRIRYRLANRCRTRCCH